MSTNVIPTSLRSSSPLNIPWRTCNLPSAEVREPPLLPAPRRGEAHFHHPRQTAELVHARGAEARVVVVEEHEHLLHVARRLLEVPVPLPHLRRAVLDGLLELLDVPLADEPQVHEVCG